MLHLRRSWPLLAIMLLAATIAAAAPRHAAAAADERCFAETGFCISGVIKTYWESNGGLKIFGYPISAEAVESNGEWTGQVQWFERDRLENHNGTVMAGLLGVDLLALQGRPWAPGDPGEDWADCHMFKETNHPLCGDLLKYWNANGGLERFGYPITEIMIEQFGDKQYPVVYTQRRRLELHLDEDPVVQLGLLGREVLSLKGR